VREIVDDHDAGRFADAFEAAAQSFEPAERCDRILDLHAEQSRRSNRRQRIRCIVPARNR
jgi:hypothetical protein